MSSEDSAKTGVLNPALVLARFGEEERIHETFLRPENVESKIKIRLHYSTELAEAFAVLRYLLSQKEWSDRGMLVTQLIITQVKNHYAAWAYRRSVLDHLKDPSKLEPELAMTLELILQEPKGFQSWDHLRFCADRLGNFSYPDFLAFMDKIYQHDSKNYHAWTFRVWAANRFGWHREEWQFVEQLLPKDVANNSIWSFRNFLASTLAIPAEQEKKWLFSRIENGLNTNESAWFYLDSIFEREGGHSPELEAYLENLTAQGKLNRFLVKSQLFNELRKQPADRRVALMDEWLAHLGEKLDPNRAKFWGGFARAFVALESK